MTKTMSIRMDRKNYEFLAHLSKHERGDLPKAVRELLSRGRILLAVETYKKREASLGTAAQLAGVPIGLLQEFAIESHLEKEDYLAGVENLSKTG